MTTDQPGFEATESEPGRSQRSGGERWLGKFRILRELGRGGMGIVYLAVDTSLDRRLAVKVLPHSVATESRVVTRFLREAQAAARLRHRNIIPIYAAGELEDTYFYSMEYVPGVTLAQIIRGLRDLKMSQRTGLLAVRVEEDGHPALKLVHEAPSLAPGMPGYKGDGSSLQTHEGERVVAFTRRNYVHEALHLFVHIADALHYAHENGIIHRDIKPSNLLMAPDGRLMLADFGLAKIGDARSITRTGDLLGSPSYMSPEQAMTRRAKVDHRTDIWSLGVTLYEFLTLHHPFEAKSLEVSLRNVLSAEPPSPRKFNPRLPKDVDTILLKTLEKNPERRYANANELADDLRSVLNYESIVARSTGPITRSLRFVRRNSTRLAVTLLSATLLLVAGIALHLWRSQDLKEFEIGAAFFAGVIENEPTGSVDQETIDQIQAALRTLSEDAPDLPAAIDLLGFDTLRAAASHLPEADSPGNLEEVIQALKKIRWIHLHNPSEKQRQRKAKLDRATAEIRVQLIWAIVDHLAGRTPDTIAPGPETLLTWLEHFLGNQRGMPSLPLEQNILVRRNAVEAVRRLEQHELLGDQVLPVLRDLIVSPQIEPEVLNDAVKALASLERAGSDEPTLNAVSRLVLQDEYVTLPVQTRYGAARLLASSSYRSNYQTTFERLRMDPAEAVQALAAAALAEVDRG